MRRLNRCIKQGGVEETTVCKELGVSTHTLLFEPEQFEANYVVMPEYHLLPENLRKAKNKSETEADRRTDSKATEFYKARVSEFMQDNAGKQVISRYQYDQCLYAIECLRAHHFAPKLLENAEFEVTLLGEIFGIPAKGRLDIVSVRLNHLTDLKTSVTAHPHKFGRTAANLNYDFKLAWYRELFRQNYSATPDVNIIVQEVSGDFDTCVMQVDGIVLDNAMNEVEEVCKKYKRSMKSGQWFGVDEGKPAVPLVVPNWKMRDELEEVDWNTLNEVEAF
jgi:hypothetical protein